MFLRLQGPVGGEALDIGDVERLPFGVVNDRAGEPAYRDQAEQPRLAGVEVEYRHGILCAVADEQPLARSVEGHRVRLGAEEVRRTLPRAYGFLHPLAARVNHTQRVAARLG